MFIPIHLIDTDHQQDDTGASNPVTEEVMTLSSDSEPLPRLKVRRVTRKVRFSHPLAYQDPQFLLKQQIHESRRHTQTNKDADLSSGLPEASRKRRTEVISNLYPFHPLAGVIRQRSILLTRIIRKLHPPPATRCSRICRLSRPYPGNDDHLLVCLSLLILLY